MVPESIFPDDILNCISSIALVVLKYPPVFESTGPLSSAIVAVLPTKCFTNVVLLGSNKCK